MTKKHRFEGEAEGIPLTEWLRGRRSDSRRRIEEVLRLFNEMLRIEAEERENHGWSEFKPPKGIDIVFAHARRNIVEHIKAKLDKQLRFYQGFNSVSSIDISGRVRLTVTATNKTVGAVEARSLNAIFLLAGQGLLLRVRQCQQCKRWFFARFDPQRSCSTKCRVKYAQSQPKWREQFNKNRREYYHKHLKKRKTKQRRAA